MAKNSKVAVDVELECAKELERLEREVYELLGMNLDDRWEKYSKPIFEKSREDTQMDDFIIEISFEDFIALSGEEI